MGLQQLFSVPGSEIVDHHYDAHDLIGPLMTQLRTELGEADSFAERVRIADEYLTRQLTKARTASAHQLAADEIIACQGCVRIRHLANMTGLSLRQFERIFARELGIAPKMYARIARFESALRMKSQSRASTWTRIAHDLRYHDQMHMVHDFQLLSGESPTSLLKQIEFLASNL